MLFRLSDQFAGSELPLDPPMIGLCTGRPNRKGAPGAGSVVKDFRWQFAWVKQGGLWRSVFIRPVTPEPTGGELQLMGQQGRFVTSLATVRLVSVSCRFSPTNNQIA
jgi:hypothetical protein